MKPGFKWHFTEMKAENPAHTNDATLPELKLLKKLEKSDLVAEHKKINNGYLIDQT